MKLQNTMFNINKGPLCHTIELLKDDIVQVRIDFCLNRNAKPGDPPMSDHPLVNRLMPLITTLKDKGYKVVEVDEDSNDYDDQYDTRLYVLFYLWTFFLRCFFFG